MMKKSSHILVALTVTLLSVSAFAQSGYDFDKAIGKRVNTISTAASFLMIAPDARGGALGDMGVATSPDVNSQHWNPAKYPFINGDYGFSVSYSPWLRKLVDDMNVAYVAGYYKLNNISAVSASLRYFSLGDITFTDENGQDMGTFNPNELAIDAAYSRKLSDVLSLSVAARYIRSDLTSGQYIGGQASKAGQSVAGDIALFYNKPLKISAFHASNLALGVNISNLGSKISYTDDNSVRDFIPSNMRLGAAFTMDFDEYNALTVGCEFNKLLVPTTPITYTDTTTGETVIYKGKDPNVSVATGIFQSFSDAPDGFSEELKEITWAASLEYWYAKQFAVRAGYFCENELKGDRKFFTVGAGVRYNVFLLDVSYLFATTQTNPLEHTLRFSLTFNFGGTSKVVPSL